MIISNALFRLLAGLGHGSIDVVAPPWSYPLVERMPEVRRAWRLDAGHKRLAPGARWRLARALRDEAFSQAIVVPRSFKAALVPWLAGIPRRTGLRGEFRFGLINDVRSIEWTRTRPMVERLCSLGLEPGERLPDAMPKPHLLVDPGAQRAVVRRLGLGCDRPVAALVPGAEHGSAKRWPRRHFAALARDLRDAGFAVWLLGSPKERLLGATIEALSDGAAVNLCGRTRLVEAIDLLGLASVTVSNDSGLLHAAAAVGSPVVALYGSSSAVYTPPHTDRRRIVQLSLDCSPCFARDCPLGHRRCMTDLAPRPVFEAALSIAERGIEPGVQRAS